MTLLTRGALYLSVIMSFFCPPASSFPWCYSCTVVTEHLGSPLCSPASPLLANMKVTQLFKSVRPGVSQSVPGCLESKHHPTDVTHLPALSLGSFAQQLHFLLSQHLVQWAPGWNWRVEDKCVTTYSEYLKLMKWEYKQVESKVFFMIFYFFFSGALGRCWSNQQQQQTSERQIKEIHRSIIICWAQWLQSAENPYNFNFRGKKS